MSSGGGRARAVLVLLHSALYQYPLTARELRARWWRYAGENFPSLQDIQRWLHELECLGVVEENDGLYTVVPPGNDRVVRHWATARLRREQTSARKRREVEPLVHWLANLGVVRAVAITGSVAMSSAQPSDDVDFLLVTHNNRLWLTRLLVVGYAILRRKRRSFAREEPNSWCFNLWLESNSLQVSAGSRSLYVAYEVCQADWVYNKHATAQQFLLANHWVLPHLPNLFLNRWSQAAQVEEVRSELASGVGSTTVVRKPFAVFRLVWSKVLDIANALAYAVQLAYMKPHRTRERVAFRYAFFHPMDRAGMLPKQLKSALNTLLEGGAWSADVVRTQSKKRGGRVLVTGVFDVLHQEHARFLQKARAVGDHLTVAIECDTRVRAIKGPGRPINSQEQRKRALEKLDIADEVVILPTQFSSAQDHLLFLQHMRPDILAVSSHTAHRAAKQKLMRRVGGRVMVVHQHNPAISSSLVIEQAGLQ